MNRAQAPHTVRINKRYVTVVVGVLLGFAGLILIFLGWFIWAVLNDEPPQFFPLHNSQGTYLITRKCPGQGNTERFHPKGAIYCVNYKGSGIFMNEENGNTNFFSVTVGKSKVDLKKFEDKQVKNIKGKFVTSSKQCIEDHCVNIKGPYVVLDIDTLDLAE